MKNIFFKLVLPIFAIIAMLGFITWYHPVQQENAAFSSGTKPLVLSCGSIKIELTPLESPSCESFGEVKSLPSYQSGVQFRVAEGTGAYTVHWKWGQYFCPKADPHAPCTIPATNPGPSNSGSGGITGKTQVKLTALSQVVAPPAPYKACGYYQDDLAFTITNNDNHRVECSYGSFSNPASSTPLAAWCHATNAASHGVSCVAPTATPTPTHAPTATPTPTPTHAPTATPTPTPTGTLTPTQTPTATPTQSVPTATPTSSQNNNCDNSGDNSNNNCNQQNQNQDQNQTQNNNQTVNITLNGQEQQQQQVLGMTSLPATGPESDIIFGLLALIPIGWKLRKLV